MVTGGGYQVTVNKEQVMDGSPGVSCIGPALSLSLYLLYFSGDLVYISVFMSFYISLFFVHQYFFFQYSFFCVSLSSCVCVCVCELYCSPIHLTGYRVLNVFFLIFFSNLSLFFF